MKALSHALDRCLYALESCACVADSQRCFRGRLCKETRKGRGLLTVASPGWTVSLGPRVRRVVRRAQRKGAYCTMPGVCSSSVAFAKEPWEALSGWGSVGPREVILVPLGPDSDALGTISVGRVGLLRRMT